LTGALGGTTLDSMESNAPPLIGRVAELAALDRVIASAHEGVLPDRSGGRRARTW
jgi:hypothetical protein